MKKSRKNENHQNSFDNSINNHVNMPETERQVIWSDLDPLYPGNQCPAINLVLVPNRPEIAVRRHLLVKILAFWTENQ